MVWRPSRTCVSVPRSRFNPQFNREALAQTLSQRGIKYVFLGEELGARSSDPHCYVEGRASYDLIAKTELFQEGLRRVLRGAETFRLALMCAEKEPLHCHRAILVARHLIEKGADVSHILADGSLEPHGGALDRLVVALRIPGEDMLRTRAQVIEDAYQVQGASIAYEERDIEVDHTTQAIKLAGGVR